MTDEPPKAHSTAARVEALRRLMAALTCSGGCGGLAVLAVTLRCGHSLCRVCYASQHRSDAARSQCTLCPACGSEHSAHYQVDITLAKVLGVVHRAVGELRQLPLPPDELAVVSEYERVIAHSGELAGHVAPQKPEIYGPSFLCGSAASRRPTEWLGLVSREWDRESAATDAGASDLGAAVLAELECRVCFGALFDPVTMACGHTFCRACLLQLIENNADRCSFCRHRVELDAAAILGTDAGVVAGANAAISRMFLTMWPYMWVERYELLQKDSVTRWQELLGRDTIPSADVLSSLVERYRGERVAWIPMFICNLAFPHVPFYLNVFEPRYLQMVRRCMPVNRAFGMALPKRANFEQPATVALDALRLEDRVDPASGMDSCPAMRYGTLLWVDTLQEQSDGRLLLKTIGVQRFEALQWRRHADGYVVCLVRFLDDGGDAFLFGNPTVKPPGYEEGEDGHDGCIDDCKEEAGNGVTLSDKVASLEAFVHSARRRTCPTQRKRLEALYGPMPDVSRLDEFSFWVANMTPMDEYERYAILSVSDVDDRIDMLYQWVGMLRRHACLGSCVVQ